MTRAGSPGGRAETHCVHCHARFAVADLVNAIDGYSRQVRVFSSRTPCCGTGEELQIDGRTLTRGYTYAAGSLHFEGMIDLPIAGLVVHDEGAAMRLTFRGRTWTVPAG
ncbi:MAG: hypothetical protein IPK07_03800 [Deltaproteobacteria bacterium]|nr:hypothetical protein [Deltaproteobacteria bacterium]